VRATRCSAAGAPPGRLHAGYFESIVDRQLFGGGAPAHFTFCDIVLISISTRRRARVIKPASAGG
jgi:hypothetical protein